ncbi:MAG: hypothetical protein H0T89_08110 [Deltaproteobacteria bacterium]|nr:hypothetical protein [Deltaproteobacteria bacterium]MDQ3296626.1 hypothetical protein [Myxococcota bacterium]
MVERQDIDALLIGSLYGELSSADEARLQAHLESHPADRSALADLTHARDVVRESRILQVQVDPPQSITAVLIQEAARRAPKPAPEHSWFQRFMRSFMLHPAMAAAAMLVLVVGVASTMYVRKGDQFASQTKAPSNDQSVMSPAAPAPASEITRQGESLLRANDDVGGGGDADGMAAGSAAYGVTLDEGASGRIDQLGAARDGKLAENKPTDARFETQASKGAGMGAKQAKPTGKDRAYLELNTPSQAPKDLDAPLAKKSAAKPTNTRVTTKADIADFGDATVGRAPSGGGSTGMASPDPTPSAPRTAAPAEPRVQPTTAPTPDRRAPAKAASPPPPVAVTRSAEEKAKTQDKAEAKPDPELVWAKEQHNRVIAQIRGNNCTAAANTALALERRAPAYYAQHVETDRTVRQCLAYITAAREKEAESVQRARATKRADEPAKATTTESTK